MNWSFSRPELSRGSLAIAQVASGSALAKGLGIAAIPILSRIYSPESFGVFSVILGLSATAIVLATLRLELAIPMCVTEPEYQQVTRTALLSSFTVGAVLVPIVWILCVPFGQTWALGLLPWLYLLGPLVVVTSWFLILSSALIRERDYKGVAKRDIASSLGSIVGQIALNPLLANAGGLILGQMLGRTGSIWAMQRRLRIPMRGIASYRQSWRSLKAYRIYPIYYVPAGLMNSLGGQLPVLLSALWFGPEIAGFVGMSVLLVAAPAALVSASVEQVLRGELAQGQRDGARNGRRIWLRSFRGLLPLASLIFLGCVFVAPWIFPIVLGANWEQAGSFARAMAPSLATGFLATPLRAPLIVQGHARRNLAIDAARVVSTGGFGAIAYALSGSPTQVVAAMSIGLATNYLATLAISWRCVR